MSSGANWVTDNRRGAGSSTRCGTATSTNARTKTRPRAAPFRRSASPYSYSSTGTDGTKIRTSADAVTGMMTDGHLYLRQCRPLLLGRVLEADHL